MTYAETTALDGNDDDDNDNDGDDDNDNDNDGYNDDDNDIKMRERCSAKMMVEVREILITMAERFITSTNLDQPWCPSGGHRRRYACPSRPLSYRRCCHFVYNWGYHLLSLFSVSLFCLFV